MTGDSIRDSYDAHGFREEYTAAVDAPGWEIAVNVAHGRIAEEFDHLDVRELAEEFETDWEERDDGSFIVTISRRRDDD